MKNNRIGTGFILVLFFCVSQSILLWGDEDIVSVRSIKLLIGESQYIWNNQESIPETESGSITVRNICSFTTLYPGKELALTRLEKEVALLEKRLHQSGYFFFAQAYIVPPKRFPESRTVMIKVTPGVLSRFGGGYLYATWARLALGGKRNLLQIWGGYNRAGISYKNAELPVPGLSLQGEALYSNSGPGQPFPFSYHSFTVAAGTGYQISPDLELTIEGRYSINNITALHPENDTNIFEPGTTSWFSINPEISWNFWGKEKHSWKGSAGMKLNLSQDSAASASLSTENKITVHLHPITFSQQAGAALALTTMPPEQLSSLQNRLRFPVDFFEVLNESVVWGNSDLSFRLFDFKILNFLSVSFEAFGFCDLGYLPDTNAFFAGYGPGIKINFHQPVYVTVELGWGWNRDGRNGFQLAVTGSE